MDIQRPITLVTMTPEQFTEYLSKAIEKGREIERREGIPIPYITEKEVMERFGYTKDELDRRVKRCIFKKFKDGNKKVFYDLNDILSNIEGNKQF